MERQSESTIRIDTQATFPDDGKDDEEEEKRRRRLRGGEGRKQGEGR